MPLKKNFDIAVTLEKEEIRISVCQLSFPNGCVLYKLDHTPGTIWVTKANGRWRFNAFNKPGFKLRFAIMYQLMRFTLNRYMYLI
jgi:hypothetical protein